MMLERDLQRSSWSGAGAIALVLAALAGAALPAAADLGDGVELHGFGSWVFAQTDGNAYLGGTEDGDAGIAEFALNVTARPAERLTLVGQIQLELTDDLLGDEDRVEAELDYAFAEWVFSDALKLRVGRVKHPFGIYAELFDVGTLRPFLVLPQGIYGSQGITAQSLNGLALTGSRYTSGDWGISYDLYAGEMEMDLEIPGFLTAPPENRLLPRVTSGFELDDLVGGRLNVHGPVDGLTVGVSLLHGQQSFRSTDRTDPATEESYDVWGAHVDYVADPWWIRLEAAASETDRIQADGAYGEVAYKITPHWQVAVRYDRWKAETPGIVFPPGFADLAAAALDHEDWGVAVNYWFNSHFVLKLNFHRAEGNRFAFPDTSEEILESFLTGGFPSETEAFLFGGQFSF